MRDTGCKMQDAYPGCAFSSSWARCSVLGVGPHPVPDIRFQVPGIRYLTPGTRYLVPGSTRGEGRGKVVFSMAGSRIPSTDSRTA
jgi:hypothetical protein